MSNQEYPRLFDRIKAAVIDGIIIILAIMLISDVFSSIENLPTAARIVAFVFVFILYDPLLISITGGTIGHNFSGIRVKEEEDTTKNITFFKALFRFMFKWLLGWVSLLTITGNKKRKAIHDYAVKSVVVYNN